MKENRKLLREVLNDIRRDMTDEEVLDLLADSKVSVRPEGGKVYAGTACGGFHRKICRKLGIYFFLQRSSDPVDGRECSAGSRGV